MKLAWCAILLLFSFNAAAQERILDFFSDISIQRDGSMIVEETIRVEAQGNRIKRGIYRDFPTTYEDKLGNSYRVQFDLLEVLRDGSSESFHTENRSNGIRIYAGRKDHFLKPGVYTYTLRYFTNRQLGFFAQHDELYWNVTGNGWEFPILQSGARVQLPQYVAMDSMTVEAYTGPQGAKGDAYQAHIDSSGAALFETTAPLAPREGLTIVTTWPKGVIIEPEASEQLNWFFADNREALIGFGGSALVALYFLLSWLRVGRDPESGVIIPHYTPPEGFSPASMRFIRSMGYDKKAFSAAIVNMAVAGYLQIEESSDGDFTLRKTGNMPKLAPGEGAIASALFGDGGSSIELKQRNHEKLGKALKAHKRSLRRDYEKIYFLKNRKHLTPGTILSVLVVAAGIFSLPTLEQKQIVGFMAVWLSGWSLGVFALLTSTYQSWRDVVRSGSAGNFIKAVVSSLFAIPFVGGEIFGIGVMMLQGSFSLTLTLIMLLLLNIGFYQWMKAPTLLGQKLLEKIEGFGNYLEVAEQDELNFKHPPEKTPELFEAYLPFAIALDVEQQWGDKFSRILATHSHGQAQHQPNWYHGRNWNHNNFGHFASTLGSSMNAAIASSSTAPGSSSGSGGGGSSGGGGGGGGGGGW
jgi:uncharacterized membrane protein YgcG